MQEALIDWEGALDRLGGDKEFLIELLHELVSQINHEFDNLKKAVAGSDFDTVKKIAHGLKGAAANLNTDRLAKLFSEMEIMSNAQNFSDVNGILAEIVQNTEELKNTLNTL